MNTYPKATGNLVRLDLADETVLYNKETHQTHSLNATAALIWKHCDGQTGFDKLVDLLPSKLTGTQSRDVVEYTLHHLANKGLLDQASLVDATMTRRNAIKRAALVGFGIALPVVVSALAPTPAQAASLLATGANCTSGSECNSGICESLKCT